MNEFYRSELYIVDYANLNCSCPFSAYMCVFYEVKPFIVNRLIYMLTIFHIMPNMINFYGSNVSQASSYLHANLLSASGKRLQTSLNAVFRASPFK